jgi:hypothetical protein
MKLKNAPEFSSKGNLADKTDILPNIQSSKVLFPHQILSNKSINHLSWH